MRQLETTGDNLIQFETGRFNWRQLKTIEEKFKGTSTSGNLLSGELKKYFEKWYLNRVSMYIFKKLNLN